MQKYLGTYAYWMIEKFIGVVIFPFFVYNKELILRKKCILDFTISSYSVCLFSHLYKMLSDDLICSHKVIKLHP